MEQYILSFLMTSVVMTLIILVILILNTLFPKAFTAKLRCGIWLVILVGLIIPLRPVIGKGLITVPFSKAVQAQHDMNKSFSGFGSTNDITSVKATESSSFDWSSFFRIFVFVWGIVVIMICAYHIWCYIKFIKTIKRWGISVKDENILSILWSVQEEIGLQSKKIDLKVCKFVSSSMLTGFYHPMILLPEKHFEDDELELIFRHELIHYKRHDLLVKLLSVIAVSLYWFNPIVYWMCASMHADVEASCDEAVLQDADMEARQFYAEVIIGMIGSNTGGALLSTLFYAGKFSIEKRLDSIMDTTLQMKRPSKKVLFVVAVLTVFSGSVFALTSHEQSTVVKNEDSSLVSYSSDEITVEEAKEISLIKTDGVIITQCKIDYEDGQKVVVIQKYIGNAAKVEIPAYVDGMPVRVIGHESFENSKVQNVIIPNTVTNIEWRAFIDCVNMTSVSIPEGVKSIGDRAFQNCKSLTSFSIPDSVTSMGERVLALCSGLTEIKLSANCEVPPYLLQDSKQAKGVVDLVIPDGVTSIGEGAIWDTNVVRSVRVPNSVTEIGWEAFGFNSGVYVYCEEGSVAQKHCDQYDILYFTGKETVFPKPTVSKYFDSSKVNPQSVETTAEANTDDDAVPPSLQTVINTNGNVSVLNKNKDSSGEFYIYEYSSKGDFIKKLGFTPELPLLGAFTKDNDGNYYILYGKSVEDKQRYEKNLILVKYSPNGSKTKSFSCRTLEYRNDEEDFFSSIKDGFAPEYCRLEISGDKIAAYFSRTMLGNEGDVNDQASSGAIWDINTLELISDVDRWQKNWNGTNIKVRRVPYISHCFDGFILPREYGNFVFASLGDGYPRSFDFLTANQAMQSSKFYGFNGENDTYAEMGGLAATEDGYIIVGTYEKARPAKDASNMFVLTMDKALRTISDPKWLTSFSSSSESNVVAPKIVQIEKDKYLIMWMVGKDTYSMVVDGKGKTVSPQIKLADGIELNRYDTLRYNPVNGLVYWAVSGGNKTIRLYACDPFAGAITKMP